jgi:cyclophilin family peptidyl-prolyl cis-trans isomerase
VRVVYRHFPLRTIHDKAMITAEASEAAGAQGKFWEMHDWLFAHQAEWVASSNITETLISAARTLGLDAERFRRDLEEGRYRAKVEAAYAEAVALGLPGTPFLLVNGRPWPQTLNYLEYAHLEAMVKLARLAERHFPAPPPMTIDPTRRYRAILKTEKGEVVIELFADRAPVTVNNFVFLARQGWYNDITFHYVISDVVAITGDPSGTGFGGPGYTIPDEITETLTFDAPGMVGMLTAGPNTGGSQFFITMAPLPQLNGRYTIFGRVLEGLEVVRALRPRNPEADPGAPPGDRLLEVVIEER